MSKTVEVLQEDINEIYKVALLGKIVASEEDINELFVAIGKLASKYQMVNPHDKEDIKTNLTKGGK